MKKKARKYNGDSMSFDIKMAGGEALPLVEYRLIHGLRDKNMNMIIKKKILMK